MPPEPIPVVVFACNRPAYLARALESLLGNGDLKTREIFVSQDGDDEAVDAVCRSFAPRVKHLRFSRPIRAQPATGDRDVDAHHERDFRKWPGYYNIAQHYGWAFRELFSERIAERLIVLEDDIEIAPDFFNYMEAVAPLMDADSTVWTVSAWNDNSYRHLEANPERLLRTDFFPGLGWLMTRALWDEYGDSWPLAHWDHWLRHPDRRKGRSAIVPEVSRTYNFGRIGTSTAKFFDECLEAIRANDKPVDFFDQDLGYLHKQTYDEAIREAVAQALPVEPDQIGSYSDKDVKLLYYSEGSFRALAERFGIMPEFGIGAMPRCSYNGVVSFRESGRRIFLVPLAHLAGEHEGSMLSDRLSKAE